MTLRSITNRQYPAFGRAACFRQVGAPWLLLLLFVCPAGCVQRRLTIRSNPPGAVVFVDNYEIGATPVSTDYIYYGTRQFRLVKDGYETLTVERKLPAPWYEWFPLDFVSENVLPNEIRDERVMDFQLMPQVIVPSQQLMGRAQNLRLSTRSGAPGAMPPSGRHLGIVPKLVPQPAPPGSFVLPPPRSVP